MAGGPTEPANDLNWPEVLSHAVHELRSPLTPLAGYLRMALKEQVGPLSDMQRRILHEAEKSCAKLSRLLDEASELAHLEDGRAVLKRVAVDIETIVTQAIAASPELYDRTVAVELRAQAAGQVNGDAVRLKDALTAIVTALRREVVASDSITVLVERIAADGKPAVRIVVGETTRMARLMALTGEELGQFDEFRGNSGLSLSYARRVIEAHGGSLLAPVENGKAAAFVTIPGI